MATTGTAPRSPGLLGRAPSGGLVVGAITSVQFGAALAHTLFSKLGPGGAVLLRLLSATIVLLLLWRPAIAGRARADLAAALVFGLILGAMNLTFYEAIDRIPLGVAVTIEFIGPLAVAIGGSRRPLDLVWVALAVLGILALTQGGTHGLNALGVFFAALAGCMWGAYILVNARVGKAFKGGEGLALAMCVATVVVVPFGIAGGGHHLLEPRLILIGAAVGMLSSAIPYSFEVEALRRIAPPVFGVLMSLEPAVAAVAGLIVLGQGLGWRAVVGIALVVAASVGASREASEPPVDA